ncbi:MAG: helix-turn-helix domain-containing protein [Acutalibacter sp.]
MSNLTQLFDSGRFPGGVEVHTDSVSATMTLDGSEHGSLRLFSLAPGVILSFNRIYTHVWPLAQTETANILLLNFCLNGRCEVDLDNGQFAFLSQEVMALGTQQVTEPYRYPSSVYEGVELFLDLDTLEQEPYCLFLEAGIDLATLIRHFQAAQKLYLAQAPAAIQGILSELWALRDTEDIWRMKLGSARLLLELERQPYVPHPRIRYFTLSQVAIAKEVHSILLSDLSQNHTARELAERFQIGETSLKNYFRGVFGENLSVWLRKARMRRAAELLRDTELRVAEIAAQVGYENQSKFAAVFARQFGCSPLEYRRRARLD